MAYSKPTTTPSRQNLVKRACDPCKVRKIKCSGVPPCNGCLSANVDCTFNKAQATRGPKHLRARTFERIALTQGTQQSPKSEAPTCGAGDEGRLTKLLELLKVYAARLYPIWPIFDAEQLAIDLAAEPKDAKAFHLAEAVALATIAQLKLPSSCHVTAEKIEKDAQDNTSELVDSLRVSFFLHIYHENQSAGGTKSLLYLREAITKAQILRIDREASYASLDLPDQQLFRRILWLLFVTERGVAMLHKLPVVLKPNVMFPWFGRSDDRAHVLPAFLKLVHLFWVFDQSGIFEILRNSDSDVSSMESLARVCLELLQKKLRDSAATDDFETNDVQRADIFVTRQWMRAVLWRAAVRFGIVVPDNNPVDVASEFLSQVRRLPKFALESQGPTLEFKTYEIATAVIDAATSHYPLSDLSHPREVLHGLQRILSSSRGGNRALLSLLNTRLAAVTPDLRLLPNPRFSIGMDTESGFENTALDLLVIEPINWSSLEQTSATATALALSTEDSDYLTEQHAGMAWPPLELGNIMRSPSPLTQMLVGNQVDVPRDESQR